MTRPSPPLRSARPGRSARRVSLLVLLGVLGPGLLAGLSDDDPAGITTYSVLGAEHGYQLLWVLLLATVALILFHDLGSRMGVVTGQGLIGLIRQRFGVRLAVVALVALVVANVGTTCAEFAGIAAGFELFGVSRYVSVPLAAVGVSILVLRGSFHRVEHVCSGPVLGVRRLHRGRDLAHPDWGAGPRGWSSRPCRSTARRDRAGHGHGRHDPGAVGAELHPVLRRRQAAHGAATCATSASTWSPVRCSPG